MKKRKYVCHFHPDVIAFVDVGDDEQPLYLCLDCYSRQEYIKWDNEIRKLKGQDDVN